MSFPAFSVTFDLALYFGDPFVVPAELNPNGADLVALALYTTPVAAADYTILRCYSQCLAWDVIAGAGSPFATGILDNGGSPLLVNNRGAVTTGGAYAISFGALAAQLVRVQAFLARRTGDGQGAR